METPKRNGRPHPLRRAGNTGILSRLTFWWVWPLIRRGYTRDHIEYDDLFQIDPNEHTGVLWKTLDREWTRELLKKKMTGSPPSLTLAVARAYGVYFLLSTIPFMIETLAILSQPVLFRILIDHFSPDSGVSLDQAYMCAAGIALAMCIQTSLGPYNYFRQIRSKVQWQAGITSLLYRKTVRLSNKALKGLQTGHIIDVITVDATTIDQMAWHLHGLWRTPMHCTVALTFIYHEIGGVAALAVCLLLTLIPVEWALARKMGMRRRKFRETTDERVTMMGEIISAVRVIKMYCWEKPFGKLVDEIRKRELAVYHGMRAYSALAHQLNAFGTKLVASLVVVTYALVYGPLPAAKLFPMFVLLEIIGNDMLDDMVWGLRAYYMLQVSLKRIQDFLALDEREHGSCLTYEPVVHAATPGGVTMCDMVAKWDEKSPKATLGGVSLSVQQGELLMVAGRVGAGKSSLLLSLLGELPITSGRVQCVGKMAYAAQQPWVFSSNIRRNILFGAPYDDVKYANVLAVCALNKDLDMLPHGDRTLVGERGVTLSGGQKARISLARALYSDADVYLLDDPLSAVDAAVGRHIFDKCINGYLRKKTRILVTHQLQFLNKADRILVLQEGHTECYGTFNDVMRSGLDLNQLVVADSSLSRQMSRQESLPEDTDESLVQRQLSKEVEMQTEEGHFRVSWHTFWGYMRAGNGVLTLAVIFLFYVFDQLTINFSDWFLSQWAKGKSVDVRHNQPWPTCEGESNVSDINMTCPRPDVMSNALSDVTSLFDHTTTCACVYMGIISVLVLVTFTRLFAFSTMASRSSRALHDMMYQAVTRAPSRFFDTNPKGRILNHFAGDVNGLDTSVPNALKDFTRVILRHVGNMAVVCVMCPDVLLAVLPVAVISMFLRRIYIRTQRHCKRLVAASGSPMLSHLSATLEGMETIRAFKAESRCTLDFDMHHTHHMSTWLSEVSVFCWFIFLANGLGVLYSGFIVFSCLTTDTALEAGEVGMVLRYAMVMCSSLSQIARVSAEVEMQMVKAERVLRYTRLPPEAPLETQHSLPTTWPSGGAISFQDVSLRYGDDGAVVLKDISCQVNGGEKVGIVGRTGAGKSSLVQALFRMVEPSGRICIDGQVTNKLGLYDLRRNMSIIPQDPVLFSGTVRRNLDPFEQCETEAIWWALQEVQLKSVVEALSDGLDSEVHEGGTNFSVGQRQLFCLARALLRKNKILILDEATANVDKHTDDMIQSTIRSKFQDCTVLTIAHRLDTVMDSDRILVMDAGQIVQFDDPVKLLEVTSGPLYKMVEQTGHGEQRRLTSLAQEARDRRLSSQDSDVLRHRFVQNGRVSSNVL